MPVSIWFDASDSPNIPLLCSSIASLLDLESMLVNEFLIEKLEKFAGAVLFQNEAT